MLKSCATGYEARIAYFKGVDHEWSEVSNWLSSNITLTVTSTYNSPLMVIGSKVNGVSYGYIDLEIPPGQTKNVALPLNNLP